MGIRTGKQYLEGLRDDREIWIEGERIADVTRDRRFAGAARTVAELLDMQHHQALQAEMTYTSPASGQLVGLSHIEPKSVEDLRRRRVAIGHWMNATQGMFGRSPDFMNCFVAAFGAAESVFAAHGAQFGRNMRSFYEHVRENDLVMTHVLINPQVDRSTSVERQEKDLAAKIVKETDAGIVIRGARMLSTLAAFADEIVVMPSTYINNAPEALDYAFGFALPTATPGMRFVSRPPVSPVTSPSLLDHPLALRLDENDAMVVFEDVLVPWERVFIHRSPEIANGLYQKTFAGPQTGHQAAIKSLAKCEFMLGLAFSIARAINIEGYAHVQGMLAEIILFTETMRACITASEANPVTTPWGTVAPDPMPLWVTRLDFARMFHRMQDIVQILGASGLIGVPSQAELASGAGPIVEQYMQAAVGDAGERIRLNRLAYDACISSFSGRQRLYERYYTGDPVRLAGTLCNIYPRKAELRERITGLLAELQRRDADPAHDWFRETLP
ncbi:4-hydroxyphenylacetate 3-hydroxylase family protein [Siccirubricoccus phaeus]|uniref:4-hydroxyphenylacetate 3-hydroxylase family protein n=1 Tax=Siccirubricoccus phaeus TaxID=2595053 RepID=UPI0011F2E18E|nr:4-hydroxyphenylacetate 3-hydroxylase N-terminal domain-containing protein [Siccirubricoccus phaeus]